MSHCGTEDVDLQCEVTRMIAGNVTLTRTSQTLCISLVTDSYLHSLRPPAPGASKRSAHHGRFVLYVLYPHGEDKVSKFTE